MIYKKLTKSDEEDYPNLLVAVHENRESTASRKLYGIRRPTKCRTKRSIEWQNNRIFPIFV